MRVEPFTTRRLAPGTPEPQGATIRDSGVNFALYSRHAYEVYLALFDARGLETTDLIRLERTRDVHHVFVEGAAAGQQYGYRVAGPFEPARGLRFNPAKLLIDPYARAVSWRPLDRDRLLCGSDARDRSPDERDSAEVAPRSIVVDPAFDWQGDRPPRIPSGDLVVYETHLKGFTAHSSSGVSRPGTYLGFIEKIPHLLSLGVNAVELLPVQQATTRAELQAQGLSDYWGYNTIGFFAPEAAYRSGGPASEVAELKELIRELHAAGIEVILDVAYNHTGEGDHRGPTLCFRGIDNPTYYRLEGRESEPGRLYRDETGALNTLELDHPQVQRLVLDSLRTWVGEMHVDGFRFDLAPLHGMRGGAFDPEAPFFRALAEDPLLRGVRLLAEPWGPSLYHLGRFPAGWVEWNDRFRDTVRGFLRGDPGHVRELGWRLTGSADIFAARSSPAAGVNFVTCHDGFTLADLWSYNRKHNEANGEGNRDGSDHDHSWNCGAEGPTSDPAVAALRRRLARASLLCLLLARGTPMLLGGDELQRSQGGNNNAYCQDNETSWLDWSLAEVHADFLRFARLALAFRRRHAVLRRPVFFAGSGQISDARPDIVWLDQDLGAPSWHDPEARSLAFQLGPGEGETEPLLYVALNAAPESRRMRLPTHEGLAWRRVADAGLEPPGDFAAEGAEPLVDPQDSYVLAERSVVVLLARRRLA